MFLLVCPGLNFLPVSPGYKLCSNYRPFCVTNGPNDPNLIINTAIPHKFLSTPVCVTSVSESKTLPCFSLRCINNLKITLNITRAKFPQICTASVVTLNTRSQIIFLYVFCWYVRVSNFCRFHLATSCVYTTSTSIIGCSSPKISVSFNRIRARLRQLRNISTI